MKRKMTWLAIVLCVSLLIQLFGVTTLAEGNTEYREELTRDMVIGTQQLVTISSATTGKYAPYGTTDCATVRTFAANSKVYMRSRDYDCFYVYWYDSNNKMVYGYIPITSVQNYQNLSYIWTSYDIYCPGVCTANTQVLSFGGTLNSFVSVGTITPGNDSLMILGSYTNQYNNVLYYFIQYIDPSDNKVYRGWVDPTPGTVSIKSFSYSSFLLGTNLYMLENVDTHLALG